MSDRPKERPEDVDAAYAFVDSMVSRADANNPYPMWHGWALRDAYLAGIKTGRALLSAQDVKEG